MPGKRLVKLVKREYPAAPQPFDQIFAALASHSEPVASSTPCGGSVVALARISIRISLGNTLENDTIYKMEGRASLG